MLLICELDRQLNCFAFPAIKVLGKFIETLDCMRLRGPWVCLLDKMEPAMVLKDEYIALGTAFLVLLGTGVLCYHLFLRGICHSESWVYWWGGK